MDNYQTKITNYNVNSDQEKPGNKSAKDLKIPRPSIEASLSNPTNQQKINVSYKHLTKYHNLHTDMHHMICMY